ncbi:MAG: rod shape-determining protein MreD [Crocinitomicaceae bacterium]|nr:rod shape-determining protein MreD [Crocinitomicaceae bacterium]
MNNTWVKYALVFVLVVLIQGLVVNNIQLSEYVMPMVYPIMILLLPFNQNALTSMLIALVLGLCVDAFSDTFGIHASAALLIGYVRPTLLKYIQPKEGYDTSLLPTVHDMGFVWFGLYASIMLLIHHLWFFSIEVFRLDLILLILGKTFMSFVMSIGLIVLFQFIFYKPSRS